MDEIKKEIEEVKEEIKETEKEEVKNKYINIEDFAKVDLKLGQILSVEKVPETDKLLRLLVDLGEETPRQIISGIALYFEDIQSLVGKKCMFVANLEPRKIKGLESNGMILALSTNDGDFSLLSPLGDMPVGISAR